MFVDQPLPGEKLLDGETVSLTRLFKCEETRAHAVDDSRLRRTTQRLVSGEGRSAIEAGTWPSSDSLGEGISASCR